MSTKPSYVIQGRGNAGKSSPILRLARRLLRQTTKSPPPKPPVRSQPWDSLYPRRLCIHSPVTRARISCSQSDIAAIIYVRVFPQINGRSKSRGGSRSPWLGSRLACSISCLGILGTRRISVNPWIFRPLTEAYVIWGSSRLPVGETLVLLVSWV